MYETCYDKLQPFFGQDHVQLHYMECDTLKLSIRIQKINIELQNLGYLFHFSNLDKNHDLICNQIKKSCGLFKIETPKNKWIDEFIALASKNDSIECSVKK